MTQQISLLAFAGSSRKDSYNKKLVSIAAQGAEKAGAQVKVIDFLDYEMPLFNEDLEAQKGLPEKARAFKELLVKSDGFLIASPEYNSSITPLLKNAIDWASRAESKEEKPLLAYSGKVAGIMSASPGSLGGLRGLVTLRSILENIQVMVLPNQRAISKAYEAFDEKGNLKDERSQASVEAIGQELVEILQKIKK